MKILFKITSILIIQAFLLCDFSLAGSMVMSLETQQEQISTLSPQINIQAKTFQEVYSSYVSLIKPNRPENLSFNAEPNNSGKDISPLAFPVKDFSRAVFPGMQIFDFGIGHPIFRDTSWERKITSHYKGVHIYGIDNDGLCLWEMATDAIGNAINRWIREKKPLAKSTIEYKQQSYLDPLPENWGKADIITLNSPKPTKDYLMHVANHDVARAMYKNLKPGGIGFILTEWHMYDTLDKPVITDKQIARETFRISLENIFGAANVIETEIPAGYFQDSLVAHIVHTTLYPNNDQYGTSFFQVRKAPEKDTVSLLKPYTDISRVGVDYSELPAVNMIIKALRESKDTAFIHKKLAFELARLLLVMFDMTNDPEMFGTIFHMNMFRDIHNYNEYKELMPIIGMAIAIAIKFKPDIKEYFMLPARSIMNWNDGQRNMNRMAGFLRDEQLAIDFVGLLEEHKDDSHQPWYMDSQIAIIDSLGAIFYKSSTVRDEVVERLNTLVGQETLHGVVKTRLQNTIDIISRDQDTAYKAHYEQLMQEFKKYADTSSLERNVFIQILRDMELKIKKDDEGDFEEEAEEAYFSDIKKYLDPIDDFDRHITRILGKLADLDEHEEFFNQVLDLVCIDYDRSIDLLLGNKNAIQTTKGIKGFEPLPLIPANWDGERCLQLLRHIYERWTEVGYESSIYYDIDMHNLISPLEEFLAQDYDPSGVAQELIDFLKIHKGIINTKNADEFLKYIEPVLDLNERTEIALRSIKHDTTKYFDLKDSLGTYINKFSKSEAMDKVMRMLKSEDGLLCEIYRRIDSRRDKPEYVNKPLISFSEAREIRNNFRTLNKEIQKVVAQGIVRQRALFTYDTSKMVPEVFLDFIFNALKSESVTAGQVVTDFITLLSGSPSNVHPFVSDIDWDSQKLTVKGEKTKMEDNISQIFEEMDYGYPIQFEVNGLDTPIDANFVYLQEIIRLGVVNSMQVASEKFEEEHEMTVAEAKKQDISIKPLLFKINIEKISGQLEIEISLMDNVGGVSDMWMLRETYPGSGRQNITRLNTSRRYKDTGLGMCKVYWATRLMAGKMWCFNIDDQGQELPVTNEGIDKRAGFKIKVTLPTRRLEAGKKNPSAQFGDSRLLIPDRIVILEKKANYVDKDSVPSDIARKRSDLSIIQQELVGSAI